MEGPTRQEIVADLRSLLGPDRALGDTVLPPVVFFATNAIAGLGWAALFGLLAGALVGVWRWARRHRLASAIYGFTAVAVSVLAALRTDRAAGYVLPTIVMTAGLAVLTVGTIIARRPMAAWVSAFVRGWPLDWYWRDDVRPAYARVSWYWFVFYVLRVAAITAAYRWGSLGVVLAVRILVSWPTMLPLLIVSYVRGNLHLARLGGPTVEEHRHASAPPYGRQRGF